MSAAGWCAVSDDDPYLLRGLLWCGACERVMAPATDERPDRWYGCGAPCGRNVAATTVESTALLAALLRANVGGFDYSGRDTAPMVPPYLLDTWQHRPIPERRATIAAAITLITAGPWGLRYTWRHAPGAATR